MIFDIIIPTTDKDLKTLETCILQCKKNLNFNRIIIISKKKYTDLAEWFPESNYPFNFNSIQNIIGDHWRTLILRNIDFFENNKALYNISLAHHKPYFIHMEKLYPSLKRISKSGITHHMIFQRNIMLDLFNRVESFHDDDFWKIFLYLVDITQKSGASEYEIYFNFIQIFHKDKFKIRKLKWKNTKNRDLNKDLDYISCHSYL